MLFDRRSYSETIENGPVAALVGHCRHKTSGDNDTASAHPFDYEDEGIVGVHNGTLRGHHTLDTHKYNKVDSEVLYGHLAANGPEDTFDRTEGAWACVWWNDNDKTLNFIRNDKRPLWFTWNEDCSMMFWASEIWMFGAISRKEKLWDGGKKKSPYVELPEDTLWSFNINADAKADEKVLTMKAPIKIPHKKQEVRGYQGNQQQRNVPSHGTNNKPWHDGDDWEEENGVWSRKGLRGPATSNPKGGEVVSPFPLQGLNDDVSDIGREQEQSNTPISKENSILSSSQPSATDQDKKLLTKSAKNTLSLPEKYLAPSLLENKDGLCEELKKPQETSILSIPRLRSGVSFRTISGIEYITDNKTKSEYSSEQFEDNTGGNCCFCKQPVGALEEVSLFLNKTSFMCKDCTEEPNVIQLSA